MRSFDFDNLPAREGMRTPYKNRHTSARFTTRTAPSFGTDRRNR